MFRLKDSFVTNERGKVMSVYQGKDNENQNIVVENKNGNVHQRWRIVYCDEYEQMQKGNLFKKFGLHVDRDFYVVSALP
jgi:hypothetical protein